ncbi:MAG: hypothetical protein WDO69_11290 [Pseudomonadota bacterium]
MGRRRCRKSIAIWASSIAGPILATVNADAYRSSFVWLYGLSALAVFFSLVPLLRGHGGAPHETVEAMETAFKPLEVVILVAIIWVVLRGRKQEWHRRWLDYRIVAELIRQLKLQIPLGGAGRFLARFTDDPG